VKVHAFWPSHVPNFKELGSEVRPSFLGYKCQISAPVQDGGFARFKISVFDRSWEWTL
jgi:hypothetical protein